MRGICSGLAVLIAAASFPALAAENIISFQNETCVQIQLEAEGNDACFGYQGCRLDIAPNQSTQVKLREGVRPKWAQVTVAGVCQEKAIRLAGQCAVDLERAFRGKGYLSGSSSTPSADTGPIFEAVTGPIGSDVAHATVVLSLGICEAGDEGDLCEVRCDIK
ncbi:MAG: hypothetical protein RLN89_08625 [Parvibaculum sp.]